MREKRQHPRATLITQVEIHCDQPSQATAGHFESQSKDISNGGMFLDGAAPCPVGTELVLLFELPGLGPVRVPGFVRWHRADGFGVQFGLLGARETHAIGRFIRANASAEPS